MPVGAHVIKRQFYAAFFYFCMVFLFGNIAFGYSSCDILYLLIYNNLLTILLFT